MENQRGVFLLHPDPVQPRQAVRCPQEQGVRSAVRPRPLVSGRIQDLHPGDAPGAVRFSIPQLHRVGAEGRGFEAGQSPFSFVPSVSGALARPSGPDHPPHLRGTVLSGQAVGRRMPRLTIRSGRSSNSRLRKVHPIRPAWTWDPPKCRMDSASCPSANGTPIRRLRNRPRKWARCSCPIRLWGSLPRRPRHRIGAGPSRRFRPPARSTRLRSRTGHWAPTGPTARKRAETAMRMWRRTSAVIG